MANIFQVVDFAENEDIGQSDLYSVIRAAVKQNGGLVGHNLYGFNKLMDEGIKSIITTMFQYDINVIPASTAHYSSIQAKITFDDVIIEYPKFHNSICLPSFARKNFSNYASNIKIRAIIQVKAEKPSGMQEKTFRTEQFSIGQIPIMVRSSKCNINERVITRDTLREICEDPLEEGGYFILRGNEYTVESLENVRFNDFHIYNDYTESAKTRIYGEFISQHQSNFGNSYQLTIAISISGEMVITIKTITYGLIELPFWMVYTLLDCPHDYDMINSVLLDSESINPIILKMQTILYDALYPAKTGGKKQGVLFGLERGISKATIIQNFLLTRDNKNVTQADIDVFIAKMDQMILPHLGTSPDDRVMKYRFIGLLIHRLLLVDIGIDNPTNRDSYSNKRIHTAGECISKIFKKYFNKLCGQQIKMELQAFFTKFREDINDISERMLYDKIHFRLTKSNITRQMERIFTSTGTTTERIVSKILERESPLGYYTELRYIGTHGTKTGSNQTERADRMRRVHPSYIGYICVVRSSNSEVGKIKELAMTAFVAPNRSPVALFEMLEKDESIIPLARLETYQLLYDYPNLVYVNGVIVGATKNAHAITSKYRLLRRLGAGIDKYISITSQTTPTVGRVEFTTDAGCLMRPLMIVDNNKAEYDAACARGEKIPFRQNISVTREMLLDLGSGKITLDDLVDKGVIEYISPDEYKDCYLAPSLAQLREDRNNITAQYTHCDIEQAIFGLTSLISPYGNHTQSVRITYGGGHARHSCGWYSFAFPFRADQNRIFQFVNEMPIVRTIVNDYVPPNGLNLMIAYMCYGGDNQEDSVIVNKESIERGMFHGIFFKTRKYVKDSNEVTGIYPGMIAADMQSNYSKLASNFIITPGAQIEAGDVLVAKYRENRRQGTHVRSQYTNCSIRYDGIPGIVDQVWDAKGREEDAIIVVRIKYDRYLGIGDKMSSRAGNKLICARILPGCDMPYTVDGICPDLIINPHSTPTRMTIGQLIESLVAYCAAKKGVIVDGTTFVPVSLEDTLAECKSLGLSETGNQTLYNGLTGEAFEAKIFMVPTAHQRIQKFIDDDKHIAVSSGPKDILTGQPSNAKRFGEMEAWGLISHGAMAGMQEKIHLDSDYKEVHVCRNCGSRAVYNSRTEIYCCQYCGDDAHIVSTNSSTSSLLMQEKMETSGVKMIRHPEAMSVEVNE